MLFPKLSQLATQNVNSLPATSSVQDAVDLMDRQAIRDVVVTGGAMLRMITPRELIALRLKGVSFNQPLADIELQPVMSLSQDKSVIDALSSLKKGSFEYVCLVDDQGALTGIVSYSDIVAHLDPKFLSEFKSINELVQLSSYVSVDAQASLQDVLMLLFEQQQTSAIVEQDGRSVGIITQQDVTHALAKDLSGDVPIAHVMTTPLLTLDSKSSLQHALSYSRQQNIRRIVVTENDKVIGLLHQKDLVALVYENWRNQLDQQQLHLQAEHELFKAGPVLLFIWQPEGQWPVSFVSENVQEVLGYSVESMMQQGFEFGQIIHPDDLEKTMNELNAAFENKVELIQQAYRIIDQQGGERWFYDYTRPIYDEQGQVDRVYGYLLEQTEIIEAKNQAQLSQARLELALESSETGLWIWDMQTNQINWSDQTYTQLGYTPQAFEVNLERFQQMLHPEDVEPLFNTIQQQVKEHHGFVVEFRVKNAQGDWSWIQGRGRVTKNTPKGEPLEMMGTHLNITAQKATTDQIQKDQQRLQNIIWGTGVGTWEWNVQTGETIFNARWAELIGYQLSELEPTTIETWMEFAHPDDLAESQNKLDAHFRGEIDHYECETRMRHKNGSWIWVLDRGKVVSWTADGKPEWTAGTHQDITQRKQAELALAEAKEELQRNQRLLEDGESLAKIGGWEYHVASQQMFWTKGLFNLHEFTPSKDFDHIAESVHCYLEQDRELIVQAFQRCIAQGESYDFTLPFTTSSNRHKWIRTKTAPLIENGQVTKVIGIVADVTEQKQTEQQLEDLVKQANAASQAKSEFLANMSHEIRTPMNGIIGLSELALKEDKVDLLHQQLGKIYRSGRLLLGIINDILDFSKIEAGRLEMDPQAFYLTKLLDEIQSLFAFSAKEKGIQLKIELAENLPVAVVADEMRLRQIVTNLLANAIKFTDQGSVTMRVYPVDAMDSSSVDPDKIRLRFEIQDTGIGMSQVQQQRLFKAFSQADSSITRKHGGTGLGLVISQRLVQALGGDEIRVESKPQQGATFSFDLPFALCSAAQLADLKSSQFKVDTLAPQLSGHILLVEDNEINQEVAQAQLRQMGFDVTLAENGAIAVEQVKSQRFDVVLMDIQMPVMDGYQATQAIRQFNQDLPIIALTAAAMIEDKQKALSVGMNGHLSKPINSELLRAQLVEVLSGQMVHVDLSAEKMPNETNDIKENRLDAHLIDLEQGLINLGDNEALYHKLLYKFSLQLEKDYASLVPELQTLAEQGQADEPTWVRLQQLNHALKGVAGNLSANALYLQSQVIDLLLKKSQVPTADMAAAFVKAYRQTQQALLQFVPSQAEAEDSSANTMSHQALLLQLQHLLCRIQQSEYIDEQELMQLAAAIPVDYNQAWLSIAENLDSFEYDKVVVSLKSLIEDLKLSRSSRAG